MAGLKTTANHASEIQVNAQTQNTFAIAGDQTDPVGVTFANGSAAAFYESPFGGPADIDIHGTYLAAADGTPTGAEIGRGSVGNSPYLDLDPQVALLTNGGDASIEANRALVVWQTGPGTDTKIQGQLVDSNGQALSSLPFTLADLPGNQVTPDVAGFQNGKSVVVFADQNTGRVDAEILKTDGKTVAVGPFTVGTGSAPAVASLKDGNFVTAWVGADVDGFGIHAQIFDQNGTKVGNELGTSTNLLNLITQGSQAEVAITALDGDNFAVAWTDSSTRSGGAGQATDTSSTAIKARVFNASGLALTDELTVNTSLSGTQNHPAITAGPNGGFVVGWTDDSGQPDAGGAVDAQGTAIKAQAFDAAGAKIGGELRVNSVTAGNQDNVDLSTASDGTILALFRDSSMQVVPGSSQTADTSGSGIQSVDLTVDSTGLRSPDATPPVVGATSVAFTDTGVAGDGTTSNASVILTASASDNVGVTAVHFFDGNMDLGAAAFINGSYTLTANLADGVNNDVFAKAYDAAGNVGQGAASTTSVTVDRKPPSVTFDPAVQFSSPRKVTLSGTAADSQAVTGIEIYEGSKDLGAASLGQNGKWSFSTSLPFGYHSDITAVATDVAGNRSGNTSSKFDLQTGVTGQPYKSIEYLYTGDGSYGYSQFGANGTLLVQADDNGDATHTITGLANGQNIQSIGNDLMTGGGAKETFVFYPNFGHAEITDFIVGGAGHDRLDLSNTQFSSLGQVLNHTSMSDGSATIHVDPNNSILLDGVTKAQLKAHPADFTLA